MPHRTPTGAAGRVDGDAQAVGERSAGPDLLERIDAEVDRLAADLQAWRREVHEHPELSWQELRTTALVTDVLAENNAVGFSGTNASGDLRIINSEWRYNMGGIVPNTLDSELLPPQGDIVIAGGTQIYQQAMPLLTHQVLTEVHLTPDGDAHYPSFPLDEWQETHRVSRPDLDWVWWGRR